MKITLLTGRIFDFAAVLGFDVRVIRSRTAKRLTLRIDEKEHCPVLTVPKHCSQKQICRFLEDNRDWVVNMMAKLPKGKKFENGDEFWLWGKKYVIVHSSKQRGVKTEDEQLLIGGEKEFLHKRMCDFLKKQALKKLSDLAVEKAKILNVRITSIVVKDTKSRWGSCSTLGNINFNWRIVMAPLFVIEYLVCHEVCHLKHPNHSSDFWKEVEQLCPDYQEGRKWLKIKGKELYKYV